MLLVLVLEVHLISIYIYICVLESDVAQNYLLYRNFKSCLS